MNLHKQFKKDNKDNLERGVDVPLTYKEIIEKMKSGEYVDLRNVEKDKAAQEYLLQRAKDTPLDKLFEEVYQNRVSHGERMIESRGMRREHAKKHGSKDEPSFLDSSEKEQDFYTDLAKEDTLEAMNWLKKELARRKSQSGQSQEQRKGEK